MKVALVHDWLTGMRGGERCLEQLCRLFPEADIYTLFHFKGAVSSEIETHRIATSFLQSFPFVKKHYRSYLPLFPLAIEGFKLEDYDLVISTSHCVAKGIIPNPEAFHLSYCFTPTRYVWDRRFDYFGNLRWVKKGVVSLILHYLRTWDVSAIGRVSRFVAISKYVSRRIKTYYHRDALVLYPPVDCQRFHPSDAIEDFYLLVSAFAPYKKIDQAILAFNKLGRRLLVVGSGQEEKRLKSLAGRHVEFLGWTSNETLAELYARCRALIFPGVEDFGLVPVEAQAAGRPVIAYGKGGALESVVPFLDKDHPGTGLFFHTQTPEAIAEAVKKFEEVETYFSARTARKNALRFDTKVFSARFLKLVKDCMDQAQEG